MKKNQYRSTTPKPIKRLSVMLLAILAILLVYVLFGTLMSTEAYADGYNEGAYIVQDMPYEVYPPTYPEIYVEPANPYAQYFYPYSHTGTVVCSRCTLRSEPNARSQEYGKLTNGMTCKIAGKYEDWLIIDMSSVHVSNNPGGYAFVKSGLIKQDPYWIATTQYTYLYATPWQTDNMRNGEQSDRFFLVIEEQYPFYAVQCTERAAGTSFIYQWDIGQYSKEGQNLYLCVEDQVPVYEVPTGNVICTVDRYTIVNVNGQSNGMYHVTVNPGTSNEFYGCVNTQHFQRIIN